MGRESVAQVNVTSTTTSLSQQGFGVPMVLSCSSSTSWTTSEIFRTYSSAAAVLVDFPATTPEYRAALRLFGQKKRIQRMGIGRLSSKPTLIRDVGVNGSQKASTRYAFVVEYNGNEYLVQFTSTSSPATDEVVTGLKTALDAISALTGVITTSLPGSSGSKRLSTTAAAGVSFDIKLYDADGVNFGPGGKDLMTLAGIAADPGTPIATQLTDLLNASKLWYAIHNPYYGKALALAIGAWAEANERVYVQASPDTDIAETVPSGATDFVATVKANSLFRTMPFYHHDPASYQDAAFLGRVLPENPGSYTGAMKTLSLTTPSELTDGQIDNIVSQDDISAKNGNVYVELGGVGKVLNGKVGGGEWFDVVVFRDWFAARLRERCLRLHDQLNKIPFTDAGIKLFESEIRAQGRDGIKVGGINPDVPPTFSTPLEADISDADKANRVLPDLNAEFELSGAIHITKMNVNLRA